jgi:hypothetical protein
MSRTRWCVAAVVAVVVAVAAVVTVVRLNTPAAPSAQLRTLVVKFEVGGDAAQASNSAGVAWGTFVRLSSGWAKVQAAGSGTVECRIVDSTGTVQSEDAASGAGNWANCSFSA